MTTTYESRTLSVRIARDARAAYDFAMRPENFSRWATGLGKGLKQVGDAWIAESPEGPVRVRFAQHNIYGILDHTVKLPSSDEFYVPMRIIPNNEGSEVLFTLFRLPGMSDKQFAADAEWVQRDLSTLKALIEA